MKSNCCVTTWRGEILAHLVFSGLALRWQKPNVLKCAVGLRHEMKPNMSEVNNPDQTNVNGHLRFRVIMSSTQNSFQFKIV